MQTIASDFYLYSIGLVRYLNINRASQWVERRLRNDTMRCSFSNKSANKEKSLVKTLPTIKQTPQAILKWIYNNR